MSYKLEDLIALAQGEGDSGDVSEVEQFMVEFELVPKPQRVPADHIYYHYIWWKEAKQDFEFLSREKFFREFRKHFKRVSDSGNKYYNVNKDAFKWDIETKILIRKLRRQEKEWYAERRKWKAQFKKREKPPSTQD